MRLPGTTNLPNKPKRDAGRTVCPTSLISFSAATCDLSDFPLPSAGEQASDDATPAAPVAIDWAKVEEHAGWLTGVEALPADFRPKGRMIVAHRGNIKELNADLIDAGLLAKGYSSWSDVTLALTAVLKADARYTTEKIAAALMCDLPCNRHVFKQDTVDDKRRAVWRAIGTARTATRVAQALAWRETKANGFPVASLFNTELAVAALGIVCSENVFHKLIELSVGGDARAALSTMVHGEATDRAIKFIRKSINDRYGFDPTDAYVRDAVIMKAMNNQYNPVVDMLDAAERDWDGVERLDRMAADYFNAADTPLNRAMVRKTMVAAARRARRPAASSTPSWSWKVPRAGTNHRRSAYWRARKIFPTRRSSAKAARKCKSNSPRSGYTRTRTSRE